MKRSLWLFVLYIVIAIAGVCAICIPVFSSMATYQMKSFDGVGSIDIGVNKRLVEPIEAGVAINCDLSEYVDKYLNDKYLVDSLKQSNDSAIYLLNNDGYYYTATEANGKTIIADSLYWIDGYRCIPFVPTGVIQAEGEISWDSLNAQLLAAKWSSFADLKSYYQKVSSDYIELDDNTQTIGIRSYQLRGYVSGDRLSTNYDVTITCTETGITITRDTLR